MLREVFRVAMQAAQRAKEEEREIGTKEHGAV